jgi:hypothetical protein
MWTPQSEKLANERGLRIAMNLDSRPATMADALLGGQSDADFRSLFNGLLAEGPFTAFRWEVPAVTSASLSRPFEFIVLDSSSLARCPDANAFAEHFNDPEDDAEAVRVLDESGRTTAGGTDSIV